MINKMDINALKQSDSICFRTVEKIESIVSTIECYRKKSNKEPFSDQYTINVDSKFITSPLFNVHCFSSHSIYEWNFCPIKTLISVLKVGDIIRLVWYKGAGDFDDLKESGFFCDHLNIEIIRKEKVKYNFLIDVCTRRDNTGRMIRSIKEIN